MLGLGYPSQIAASREEKKGNDIMRVQLFRLVPTLLARTPAA